MRIFGVVGWKNSGKTHLMVRLVSEFTARGYSVSTIKHAHHSLEFVTTDDQGFEQRPAGAHEAIFASSTRWSLTHETPADGEEEPLAALLARLQPVDLVMVEGYKLQGHTKLESYRAGSRRELIARNDERIVVLATDADLSDLTVPVIDLNDTVSIANFIEDHVKLSEVRVGA